MEKRKVYGKFKPFHLDVQNLDCGCTARSQFCERSSCREGCTEYALVNPQALEAVESLAAKVPDLEREVEALKAVCGKKDEAFNQIMSMLETHDSLGDCGKCDHRCVGDEPKCVAHFVREIVIAALSLTPASVGEEAADARIGSDVVEWYRSRAKVELVLNPALEQLGEVIAKAREVTP